MFVFLNLSFTSMSNCCKQSSFYRTSGSHLMFHILCLLSLTFLDSDVFCLNFEYKACPIIKFKRID